MNDLFCSCGAERKSASRRETSCLCPQLENMMLRWKSAVGNRGVCWSRSRILELNWTRVPNNVFQESADPDGSVAHKGKRGPRTLMGGATDLVLEKQHANKEIPHCVTRGKNGPVNRLFCVIQAAYIYSCSSLICNAPKIWLELFSIMKWIPFDSICAYKCWVHCLLEFSIL